MSWTVKNFNLSGYYGYPTILTTYNIPTGIDNISNSYRGTHMTTYLPANKLGYSLLLQSELLFEKGYLFRVKDDYVKAVLPKITFIDDTKFRLVEKVLENMKLYYEYCFGNNCLYRSYEAMKEFLSNDKRECQCSDCHRCSGCYL